MIARWPLAAPVLVLMALAAAFVTGLPSDFGWGDHTAYYYRIVDSDSIGLDARSYSLWALAGKPFLALWPGVAGYHVYVTGIWLLQLLVLFGVLRFLGAGPRLAAALVFAHGLGYPLRSVGLVSSPKVFWLLTFDLLVVVMVRLEQRPSRGRLALVVAAWALSTLAHRFGLIAAMPLFLGVALCWPNRRLWLTVAGASGVAVLGMAVLMLTSRSAGSSVWGFFASHFTLAVPAHPLGTLSTIGKVFVFSGLAGGVVLLDRARRVGWSRPTVVFLVAFSAGVLAFAILFPTGEKAMFLLPILHSMVFVAAMAGAAPLPGEGGRAAAIAAGSLLTLVLLPWLALRGSDVPHPAGPYHDYGGGFFGLLAPAPGMKYARDVVAALPAGSVIHTDWGVKPMLRHLIRGGEMPAGVYLAKETEPDDPEAVLRHYWVASPWLDLPDRIGPVDCTPLEDLASRGLRVGRLRLRRE